MASRSFGLWSGVGLVVADMVAAGVFLSTGFMSQSMPAGFILAAWVVGGVMAMAGARAYAEVARLVPRGGGEYRYLHTLLHPSLGFLAGWASVLVGFSAPVAIDALAAGAFAHAVLPALEPRWVAVTVLVAVTLLHAFGVRVSAGGQNLLVALKVALLLGFAVVGATAGTVAWPSWTPSQPDTSAGNFASQLFWIAFAYTGWNAAAYAADNFKEPARDVPRAMMLGCGLVGCLYLVLNYIFVANLTPAQGTVVFNYDAFTKLEGSWDQVTLGQALMGHLLGPTAAKAMAVVTLLIFVSAISGMMYVGPRVSTAMAADGVLPRAFAEREGKPPVLAVLLQGALALLILLTHDLQSVLSDLGAVLTFFSALTASGLFAAAIRAKSAAERPRLASLGAAALYVVGSGVMLVLGVKNLVGRGHTSVLWWGAGIGTVSLVAWVVTRLARANSGRREGR